MNDAATTPAFRSVAESPALPNGHPPVKGGKVGVLLLNLGTPDGTDYWSMRRYLKEFLSDRRVIEVPRLIWWPILNRIILTTRPGRKGKDYASIWNNERNEGPAEDDHARRRPKSLARRWPATPASSSTGPCAMPIPRRQAAFERCRRRAASSILLVPLYPQYAAATTATAAIRPFAR